MTGKLAIVVLTVLLALGLALSCDGDANNLI